MTKNVSYYDWQLGFRKRKEKEKECKVESKVNSINIKEKEFKRFLKNWREKNL